MTALRRRGRAFVTVGALAVLLSGCGLDGGLRSVPLPGGADLGDAPYSVDIEFADVVDLVPQSAVKVADVPVGTVSSITLDPRTWNAKVSVAVNGGVHLPANAEARVRTTSLLGEKFVELAPPAQGAAGVLADGATIPLARTSRAVEVEEVFGALSMLLNGGGVAQVRTIAKELDTALDGREPQVRDLLADLDALVGALDSRRGDIVRALDGLDRLAATLNDRRGQIEAALTDLHPGLAELEAQRGQLVDMLQALDRLSGVVMNVVKRSRADTVADLRAVQPVLTKLAESGQDLPESLQLVGSFPFTDYGAKAFAGDYANLYVRADLDLKTLLDNLARSNQPFPGPDFPLLGQLPPTAQLLSPLLGGPADGGAPQVPLLGPVPAPQNPPSATPAPSQSGSGGLLGGLGGVLGGGS